jgi:hypothetical protein
LVSNRIVAVWPFVNILFHALLPAAAARETIGLVGVNNRLLAVLP